MFTGTILIVNLIVVLWRWPRRLPAPLLMQVSAVFGAFALSLLALAPERYMPHYYEDVLRQRPALATLYYLVGAAIPIGLTLYLRYWHGTSRTQGQPSDCSR